MNHILCFLAFIGISLSGFGQTPSYSWAKRAGGTNSDEGRKLVVDSAGNTYVIGECRSTPVHFGNLSIASAYDNFVVKYGPAGNEVWAQKMGKGWGTGATSSITQIELDPTGRIVITGNFYKGLIVGADTLQSIGFGSNTYIAKFSPAGNGLWAKNKTLNAANPSNNLTILNIKRLNAKGFVVIGYSQYSDTLDQVVLLPHPGYFIATLDTAGNFTKGFALAVDTLPSQPSIAFSDIATNKRGNIYLSGNYSNFRPEIDTIHWHLPLISPYNLSYIAKFDNNLQFQWARTNDYSASPFWCSCGNGANYTLVTADDDDNVYQTGEFFADTMFYGSQQVTGWNAVAHDFSSLLGGSGDIYLVKLNGDGVAQWLRSYQSNNNEYPQGMCHDQLGNVYITGVAAGNTGFDGRSTANSALYSPLFVTKVTPSGKIAWLQGASNCNVFSKTLAEDGKGNVLVSGGYYGACDAEFGHDTLVHYAPLPNTGAEDMFTVRIGNCNLAKPTIAHSSPLSWCGADSVVLSASGSSHYQWSTGDTTQSIVVHSSGNYLVYALDSLGCYAKSVPITTVAFPLPATPVVTQSGTTLSSTPASFYQWYFGGTLLPGATSQDYHPGVDGNYSVQIRDGNGCGAMSDPFAYLSTEIQKLGAKGFNVTFLPNPSSSETIVSFTEGQINTSIQITDVHGKLVRSITFTGSKLLLERGNLQAGIYLIRIMAENGNREVAKLMLE